MHPRHCSSHVARQLSPLQGALHKIHVLPQVPAQVAPGASARGVAAAGLNAAREDRSACGPTAFAPPSTGAAAGPERAPLLALVSDAALAGIIVCGGGA